MAWRRGGNDVDWVAIDLETTGLRPGTDRIVEVGVVRFDAAGREIDAWTTLLDPQRDMGATFVHGIETRHVLGAPVFRDAASEILGRLANARLVAHNARFDLGFLTAELERIGVDWGEPEAFCTMTVPYQLGVVHGRQLQACCAELGIAMSHDHTALGDARATGAILFATLPRVRFNASDMPGVSPSWSTPSSLLTPRLRSAPPPITVSVLGPLAARVGIPQGLPVSDEVALAYMGLLDRVLEDRRLTEDEVAALTEAAGIWRVGADVAADIHRAYLAGVGELALADGVITDAERSDLARLTELLGVGPAAHERLIGLRPMRGLESFVGRSVCFTGESVCTIDGIRLSRAQQAQLAEEAGLIVTGGVSRRLDMLVLADPDSQSGKAKRAGELGVRRVSELAFWRAIGAQID
jgi:DNA polymerase-3 subunit epsilon